MNRLMVLLFVVVLAYSQGCSVPVASKTERAGASSRPRANSARIMRSIDQAGPTSASCLSVNGELIDATDMWRDLAEELSGRRGSLPPKDYRQFVEQRAVAWITDKVTETLLHQQASLRISAELSPRVDQYVDSEIRKIITNRYGGVQRRFEKYLASIGLTIDDVHEKMRRQIIIADYFEREIRPRIAEPTRADLYAAFEENSGSWRRPARRRMSLIDVRVLDHLAAGVDNPTREEHEAARSAGRAIIEDAHREVSNGTDFGEAARRYSDGLHAAEGGSWGWVSPGSVRERFEPAVEALYRQSEGEVSDIIETDDGFFLVRCDEFDPAVEPSFEDIQPALKEHHYRVAHNRLVAELVTKLRRKAPLETAELERFHGAVVVATLNRPFEAPLRAP